MSAPPPPHDLDRRTPLTHEIASGVVLYRFFRAALDPIYYDRGGGGRLNAPNGSYGVLYAAERPHGAFAETFLRVPGQTLIPRDLIAGRALVELVTARPLVLVQLVGPGLARLGATAEVPHGGLPYDVPQAWSAALQAHPLRADGIAYRARHDDAELCYAIFDRASGAIAEHGCRRDLDQDWFYDLTEHYGVGLAPDAT